MTMTSKPIHFKARHFLDGLDRDIQENLLSHLGVLWTHHSTGIEGNTLTLGETEYVLTQGLTVDGKPVKDHNEVIGHGKAVDWIIDKARQDNLLITNEDLFALHKMVQTEIVTDTFKPCGAWKVEPNGTMAKDAKGNLRYVEFATPKDVPFLMEQWVEEFNHALNCTLLAPEALQVFASIHTGFVKIHPFWDGNGRMARLLANLPLLRSGLPPVVIRKTMAIRNVYISLLQDIQEIQGTLSRGNYQFPIDPVVLAPLIGFCGKEWEQSLKLVQQAHEHQAKRETSSN